MPLVLELRLIERQDERKPSKADIHKVRGVVCSNFVSATRLRHCKPPIVLGSAKGEVSDSIFKVASSVCKDGVR